MVKNFVMAVGITVALVAIGFFLGRHETKAQARIDETVIVERVREVAKLATVEHYVSDIISDVEKTPWWQKDRKMLVIAKGRVLAGFDLKKPLTCQVQTSGTNITVDIHLPKAEIIAVDASYQTYDMQNPSQEQIDWLHAKAKDTLRIGAVKTGIYNDAERSMAMLLSGMFPSVKFNLTFGDKPYSGPKTISEWNPAYKMPGEK